jgi:hypothetical protein
MPHRGRRPCELDHSPVGARMRHNRNGTLFCATGGRLNGGIPRCPSCYFTDCHNCSIALSAYLGTLPVTQARPSRMKELRNWRAECSGNHKAILPDFPRHLLVATHIELQGNTLAAIFNLHPWSWIFATVPTAHHATGRSSHHFHCREESR